MNRALRVAAALLACAGLSSGALAASDRAFLKKAMQGDNSEMNLGRIAERSGASRGVKEFGRTLHVDHSRGKADAVRVARAHGLAATSEMMPEAKREERKLARLSGRAFDREFARYMVDDHRRDIADFRKQARTGDRETAALARRTLPVLQKHLRMAEALAR